MNPKITQGKEAQRQPGKMSNYPYIDNTGYWIFTMTRKTKLSIIISFLKAIKSISSSFDNNFYNIVKKIFQTKGRVIVTGIGKSGHIANKIALGQIKSGIAGAHPTLVTTIAAAAEPISIDSSKE